MMLIRSMFAVALLISAFGTAFAADPVFPPGIRVGLTPLVGLSRAKTFVGFETEDQGVKVLVAELPAEAYTEVMNAFKKNPAGTGGVKPESIETSAGLAYYTIENAKDGPTNVRRYSMILPGGAFSGYIAVQVPGKRLENLYRRCGPADVRLGRGPQGGSGRGAAGADAVQAQRISAASGMSARWRSTRPSSSPTATRTKGFEAAPFMVIGIVGTTPNQPEDRGRFAQQVATTIPGMRDARVTMSEPLRIDGTPGYETRIEAVSGKDNTPVTVVQWLRFGSQSTLRIIASAPREQWASAFPRFRAVRDGIQPR